MAFPKQRSCASAIRRKIIIIIIMMKGHAALPHLKKKEKRQCLFSICPREEKWGGGRFLISYTQKL
jgi:hypothetical protein